MGVPVFSGEGNPRWSNSPGNLQTKIQTGRRKEYEFSTLRH